MVINLHRFFSSGLITVLSGAAIKTGFNKNPLSFLFTNKAPHIIGDGRHEVERNASLVANWCDQSIVKPKLYPGSHRYRKNRNIKK